MKFQNNNVQKKVSSKRPHFKRSKIIIGASAVILSFVFLMMLLPLQNPDDFSLQDFGKPDIFASDDATTDSLDSSSTTNVTDDTSAKKTDDASDTTDKTTEDSKDKTSEKDSSDSSKAKDNTEDGFLNNLKKILGGSDNENNSEANELLESDAIQDTLASEPNGDADLGLGDSNDTTDGQIVYDFSDYNNTTITLDAASTLKTEEHAISCGTFKFYGPKSSGSRQSTTITKDGYSTDYSKDAYSSEGGSNYHYAGDNYFQFKPNVDITSITITLQLTNPYSSTSKYMGNMISMGSSDYYSHPFLGDRSLVRKIIVDGNKTTTYTLTFTPDGGFKKNTTYYFAPSCTTTNSSGSSYSAGDWATYYKYSGIKLKTFSAKPVGVALTGNITNVAKTGDVKLTFKPDDTSISSVSQTVSVTAGTASSYTMIIPTGKSGKLEVEHNNYTKTYNIAASTAATTQDVDLSGYYGKVKGKIKNSLSSQKTFTVEFPSGKTQSFTVGAGAQQEFTIEGLSPSDYGVISVSCDGQPKVCKYIKEGAIEGGGSELDCGMFEFSSSITSAKVNLEYCTNVSFTYEIDVIGGESGDKYDLDIVPTTDSTTSYKQSFTVPDGSTVKFTRNKFSGRRLYTFTDGAATDNGQQLPDLSDVVDPNSRSYNEYLSIGQFSATNNLNIEEIQPTYDWTNGGEEEPDTWSCKASYIVPKVGDTPSSPLYTSTVTGLKGTVKKRASTTAADGTKTVTATFTKTTDTPYFDTATHDYAYGPEVGHIHDGLTFVEWTGDTLPTQNPTEAGYDGYYLTKDITLSSDVTISSNLNLCLNGHVINCMYSSGYNYNITISDPATVHFYNDNSIENDAHYFNNKYQWQKNATTEPSGGYTVNGGCVVGEGRYTSTGSSRGRGAIIVESGARFDSTYVNYIGNSALQATSNYGQKCSTGGAIFYMGNNKESTIKGGLFLGNTSAYDGGAITFLQTSGSCTNKLILEDVTFDSNRTYSNGGGALFLTNYSDDKATFQVEADIKGCVFQNNICIQKGGGAFFQSKCINLTDTSFINNIVGLKADGSVNEKGWGGGFVINPWSVVNMFGKIVIFDNLNKSKYGNSAAAKGGGGNDDNLSVEYDGTDTLSTSVNTLKVTGLATINLTEKLSEGSKIGFNIYEWQKNSPYVGRVTTSASNLITTATVDGKVIKVNANNDFFFKDNVLPSTQYSTMLFNKDATVSGKNYVANGDIYITAHVHNYRYETYQSVEPSGSTDSLKTYCTSTSDTFICTHSISNPINCTLAFDETSPIECDNKEHEATLSNADMLNKDTGSVFQITDTKNSSDPAEAITYQKWVEDSSLAGGGQWVDISGKPSAPNTKYRAVLTIKCALINSSSQYYFTDGNIITLYSNELFIKPKTVNVNVSLKDKTFDDTRNVVVSEDTWVSQPTVSGQVEGDTVEVISFTATVDAESKYVGQNIPLTGLDASSVRLKVNGKVDDDSYTIANVTGTVNIVAAEQNINVQGKTLNTERPETWNLREQIQGYYSGHYGETLVTTKFQYVTSDFTLFTKEGETKIPYTGTDYTEKDVFNDSTSVEAEDYKIKVNVLDLDINGDGVNEYNGNTYTMGVIVNDDSVSVTYEIDSVDKWGRVEGLKDCTMYPSSGGSPSSFRVYRDAEGYYNITYSDSGQLSSSTGIPGDIYSSVNYKAIPDSPSGLDSYYFEKWEIIATKNSKESPQTKTWTITKKEIDDFMDDPTKTGCWFSGYHNSGGTKYSDFDTYSYYNNVVYKAYFKPVDRASMEVEINSNKATDTQVNSGDMIKYSATITNTGNVDLTDVKIQDPLCGYSEYSSFAEITEPIKPGESATVPIITDGTGKLYYTVNEADIRNGSVTNTIYAKAKAVASGETKDVDCDSASITHKTVERTPDDNSLDLEITPSVGSSNVHVGDKITYTIKATNKSNVKIENLTISESSSLYNTSYQGNLAWTYVEGKTNYWEPLKALVPGASTTKADSSNIITAEYTVKAADIDSSGYINFQMTINGNVYNSNGQNVGVPSATCKVSNQVENKTAILPTLKSNLTYSGETQEAFSNYGEGVSVTANSEGKDAKTYYASLKLERYYKWPESTPGLTPSGDTATLEWSISPKSLTLTNIKDSQTYDGSVLSVKIKDKITGFVSLEGGNEGLSDTSNIATNSPNANTYKKIGTQTTWYTSGTGGNIELNITPNEITNLSNYTLDWGVDTTTKESTSVNLIISQRSFSDKDITVSADDLTYTGANQNAKVTVKYGTTTLTVGDDYELSEDTVVKDARVGSDKYTVKATGKGNYKEAKSDTFNVNKAEVKITITGHSLHTTYNGSDHTISNGYDTPTLEAPEGSSITFDSTKLSPASTECSVTGKNAGTYNLQYKNSQGNYVDLTHSSFKYDDDNVVPTIVYSGGVLQIGKQSITDISQLQVGSIDPQTYNGTDITVSPTIKFKSLDLLIDPSEYELSGNTEKNANTAGGSYTINIAFNEINYTGSLSGIVTWKIIPAELNIKYTGTENQKEYDATIGNGLTFETVGQNGEMFKTTIKPKSENQGSYKYSDSTLNIQTSPVESTTFSTNYTYKYDDKLCYTINPRTIIIKADGLSTTFNNKNQSLSTVHYYKTNTSTSDDGLLSGHKVTSVTWQNEAGEVATPTQKNANTYKYKVSNIVIKNGSDEAAVDVTSNYSFIPSEFAELEIAPATVDIKVTGTKYDNKKYTGYEQSYGGTVDNAYSVSFGDKTTTGANEWFNPATMLTPAVGAVYVKGKDVDTYNLKFMNGTSEKNLEYSDFKCINSNFKLYNDKVTYEQGFLTIIHESLTITVKDSKTEVIDTNWKRNISTSDSVVGFKGTDNLDYANSCFTTNNWISGEYKEEGSAANQYTKNLFGTSTTKLSNYDITCDVCLTINKKMTITINGNNDTQTYDGKPHSVKGYVATCGDTRYKDSYLKLKEPTKTSTEVIGTNAGTYNLNLDVTDFVYEDPTLKPGDDYDIVYNDGALTINPLPITGSMVRVNGGTSQFSTEYNGKNQRAQYTLVFEDGRAISTSDYTVEDSVGKDADKYNATIVGSHNLTGSLTYENCSLLTWTIYRASATINITGNTDERTYNGKKQTFYGYSASSDSPLVDIGNISPDKNHFIVEGTDADTYQTKMKGTDFVYGDSSNVDVTFNIAQQTTLVIKKANINQLNITMDDDEYVYDKSEHLPNVEIKFNNQILDNNGFNFTNYEKKVNADNYVISITPNANSNFEGVVNLTWKITKAPLRIGIAGSNIVKEYDGTEYTVSGFIAPTKEGVNPTLQDEKGVYNQGNIKSNQELNASRQNAGTTYMNLDVSKFTYNDTNVDCTFYHVSDGYVNITPVDISNSPSRISVKDLKTYFIYNAKSQGPTFVCADSVTGKNLGLDVDYVLEGNSAVLACKNGDKYTLIVRGTGNYTGEVSYDWKIDKATMRVSITGNTLSTEYDGDVKSVTGYKCSEIPVSEGKALTNLLDESLINPISGNVSVTNSEVGKHEMGLKANKFNYADTDNINAIFDPVTDGYLDISKKNLSTYTASASNLVYSGSNQSTTVTVHSGASVLTQNQDYYLDGETSGKDVGTYTLKVIGKGNFEGHIENVKWNIKQAEFNINVVGEQSNVDFDGNEHSISKYSLNSDSSLFKSGKVKYTEVTGTKTATGKMAGTYQTNMQSSDFEYEDTNVKANFVVTQGKLVISKAAVSISFRAAKKHDGTKLEFSFDSSTPEETKPKINGLVGGDAINSGTFSTNDTQQATYKVCSASTEGYSADLKFTPGIEGSTLDNNYSVTYDGIMSITDPDENTIVVTGNTSNIVYDGDYHSLSGWSSVATFGGFDADKVKIKTTSSVAGKQASITDKKDVLYENSSVASYKYGLTADDFYYDDNNVTYKIKYTDGALTINPKELNPSMLESYYADLTYSGNNQTPSLSVVDNNAKNQSIISATDFEVKHPLDIKNVGSYNSTIEGKNNYCGKIENILWNINKATLYVNLDYSKQYDNNFIEYSKTGAANDSSCTITGIMDADWNSITVQAKSRGVVPGVYYEESDNAATGYYASVGLSGQASNNYDIKTNIKLTIYKRSLTVKPTDHAYNYDKSAHKLLDSEIVYTTLVPGQTVSQIVWDANNSQTNVGQKENVRVIGLKIAGSDGSDVTGYYSINYLSGILTVNKTNIKIKVVGNKSTVIYDGKGHSLPVNATDKGYDAYEIPVEDGKSITGLFDGSLLTTNQPCRIDKTEIGTYTLDLDESSFNYNDSNVNATYDVVDGELVITEASFSSCQFYTINHVYDNTEKSAELTITNGTNSLVEGTDYVIESGSTKATNAGTYTIKIKGIGNYAGSTKDITWTISKAQMTINVKGNSKSVPYSGAAVTFPDSAASEAGYTVYESTNTKLYDPDKFTKQPSTKVVTRTEIGTSILEYNVNEFEYKDDNVVTNIVIDNNATLTITQADITSTFTVTADPLTYNATYQKPKITVKNSESVTLKEGVDYEVLGVVSQINSGTYYAKVSGIGNYTGTLWDVPWGIAKANMTVAVFGKSRTTIYNGSNQSVSGFVAQPTIDAGNLFDSSKVALASGVSDVVNATYASKTPYKVSLTADDFVYNDNNVIATFVKGSQQNATSNFFGFSLSNVVNEVLNIQSAFADDEAIMENTLTINQATLTIKATDIKKHDTTVLVHKVLNTEVDGLVADQVLIGTIKTNSSDIGDYPVSKLDCSFSVDGVQIDQTNAESNYVLSNDSLLSITGDNTVVINGTTKTYPFEGKAHSMDAKPYTVAASFEGFDETKLDVTCKDIPKDKVNAGTYALTESEFSATYEDTSVTVKINSYPTMVISQKSLQSEDVTAICNSVFKYDGTEHEVTASDVDVTDSKVSGSPVYGTDYTLDIPAKTSCVNPDTYTITVKATPGGNYKESTTCTFVIQKAYRVVKVSGNHKTQSYSGAEVSAQGYEAKEYDSQGATEESSTKIITADSITPAKSECSASGTLLGTYPMGLNIADFKYNGSNKSYVDVEFVLIQDGYVEITKGSFDVVTLESDNFTYNKQYQTAVVNNVKSGGVDVDPSNYVVTNNSQIDANTYELLIIGKNNFAGTSKTVPWTINKAIASIAIKGTQKDVEYTGTEQTAVGYTATVTGVQADLVETDNITPSYNSCIAKQTELGKNTMGLTPAKFSYSDTKNYDITFTMDSEGKDDGYVNITKRDLANVTYTSTPRSFVYNGQKQIPASGLYNGETVIDPSNYTLEYKDEDGNVVSEPTNVDTYKSVYTAKSGTNYTGTLEFKWTIDVANITLRVIGQTENRVYNRDTQESEFVPSTTGENPTITEKTNTGLLDLENFEVTIDDPKTKAKVKQKDVGSNSTNYAAEDFKYNRDEPWKTGKSGNTKTTFEIVSQQTLTVQARSIDPTKIGSTVSINVENKFYTGNEQSPTITLKDTVTGEEVKLSDTTEYSVDVIAQRDYKEGGYKVTIRGIGNYCDTVERTWNIDKPTVHLKITGKSETKKYNGGEQAVYGYIVDVVSAYGISESGFKTNYASSLAVKDNPYDDGYGIRAKATNVAYDASGNVIPAAYMGLGTVSDPNFVFQNDNINVVYDEIIDGYITIEPVEFDKVTVALSPSNKLEYNGQGQIPEVKLTIKDDNNIEHEIGISNVKITGDKKTDVNDDDNPYQIIATPSEKGNIKYDTTKTNTLDWWITPRPITLGSSSEPFIKSLTAGGSVAFTRSNFFYSDGSSGMCSTDDIYGTISIDSSVTEKNRLYKFSDIPCCLTKVIDTAVSEQTKKNYDIDWNNVQIALDQTVIDPSDKTKWQIDYTNQKPYSGEEQDVGGTVSLKYYKDSSWITLNNGTDFIVTCDKHRHACVGTDTYSMTVSGVPTAGYIGDFTLKWTITPKAAIIKNSDTNKFEKTYGDYIAGQTFDLDESNFEDLASYDQGTFGAEGKLKFGGTIKTVDKQSTSNGTDAGTYSVNPDISQPDNLCQIDVVTNDETDKSHLATDYSFTKTATITINKKTVSVVPNVQLQYTRQKQTIDWTSDASNGYVEGVVNGQVISGQLQTSGAELGTYKYKDTTNRLTVAKPPTPSNGTKLENYNIDYKKEVTNEDGINVTKVATAEIVARTIDKDSVTISLDLSSIPYDGKSHQAKINSVTDTTLGALSTDDYQVSKNPNESDAGTYTVKIEGKGHTTTTEPIEATWTITPREVIVSATGTTTYNGEVFEYTYGNTQMFSYEKGTKGSSLKDVITDPDANANLEGKIATSVDGSSADGKDVGEYKTSNTGEKCIVETDAPYVASGTTTKLTNYNFTYSSGGAVRYDNCKLTISEKSSSGLSVKIESEPEYDGLPHNPTVEVKDGTTVLTEGKDYTLSDPVIDVGPKQLVVMGMGNYKEQASPKEWSIQPRKIALQVNYDGYTYDRNLKTYNYSYEDFKYVKDGALTTTSGLVKVNGTQQNVTGKLTTIDAAAYIYKYSETKVTESEQTFVESTGAKAGNYIVDTTLYDVSLTIKPYTLNIANVEFKNAEFTYDGKTHAPELKSVTDGKLGTLNTNEYVFSYDADAENAGTYKAYITGKGSTSIVFPYEKAWQIKPREVIVSKSDIKTYDGTELASTYGLDNLYNCVTDAEGKATKGQKLSEVITGADTKAQFTGTIATSADGVNANGKNAGTYTYGATSGNRIVQTVQPTVVDGYYATTLASNYNFKTDGAVRFAEDTILTINPLVASLQWNTVSEWVYDAQPHSVTCEISNKVESDVVNVVIDNSSITNVGKITAKVLSLVDGGGSTSNNYSLPTEKSQLEKTMEVTPATLQDINVEQPQIPTYNGTTQDIGLTANATPVGGATLNPVSFTFSTKEAGTYTKDVPKYKDAGTYTIFYKVAAPNHYDVGPLSVSVVLDQKAVTVTPDNASKMYGEKDPVLTAQVKGLIDGIGDTISYKLSRDAGENIGLYNINATGEESQENYIVTYKNPGQFSITESDALSLTFDAEYSREYNSKEISQTVTAEPSEGTTIEYSTDGGVTWSTKPPSLINVGSITVDVKANKPNYKEKTGQYKLEVTPKPVTISAQPNGKVYGDSEPKLEATVDGLIEGTGETVKYSVARDLSKKDAGIHYDNITVSADVLQGNYEVSTVPADFTIAQRVAILEWSNLEYTYDGNPHSAKCDVTNKVDADECNVSFDKNSYVDAGRYLITASGLSNNNYVLPSETSKVQNYLTIKAAEISSASVTQAETLVYNGDAQTAKVITEATPVAGQPVTFTYSDNPAGPFTDTVPAFTDAGDHTVYFKASAPNHDDYAGNFVVKIDQKKISIKADDKKKFYTGKIGTDPELTATVTGLVEGDTVDYDLSREKAGTIEGEAIGTYEIYVTGQQSQGNYLISEFKSGTLTIVKELIDISKADVELGKLLTYDSDNPQPQTQEISKVVLDGRELIEGKDYEIVEGSATATEPGKHTLIIKAIEGSEYTGTKEVSFVIVGPTQQDLDKIHGKGDVVVDVESEKGAATAEIESAVGDIIAELSDANELRDAADGKIKIRVWISIKDITKTISAESKSLLDAETSKVTNRQVGQYDDISMFKTVTDNESGKDTTTQINELKNAVSLKLYAPDSMIPGPEVASCEMGLFRNHQGKVQNMDPKYDSGEYALHFSSDKFSDYAITMINQYSPSPIEDNPWGLGKTGDYLLVMACGSIALVLALVSAYLVFRKSKKRDNY